MQSNSVKNSKVKKVQFSGNKSVSASVATGRVNRMRDPSITSSARGDGRIRVSHREYIADVTVQSSFTATNYAVNPGMSGTFAWLSNLAANYESYQFRRLAFEFETQCPTSTAGSIQMAMDYDAADSSPSSKQALMSYHNAVRSPAWSPCMVVCDASDLVKFGTQRFVRTSALAANLDLKTYDVGNLWIASSGGAGVVAGELYVSYEIELMTPQTAASGSSLSTTVMTGASSISKTAIFGAAPTFVGGLLTGSVTNTLVFPIVGHYLVNLALTADGLQYSLKPTGTAACIPLGLQGTTLANSIHYLSYSVVASAANQTVIFDFSGNTNQISASTVRVIRDAQPDFAAL